MFSLGIQRIARVNLKTNITVLKNNKLEILGNHLYNKYQSNEIQSGTQYTKPDQTNRNLISSCPKLLRESVYIIIIIIYGVVVGVGK